jgi:transcriptional regulator with XRE-family HTH domain
MTCDKQSIQEEFGITIKRLRRSAGLSQEALGQVSNFDRTYISGIERGARNPSLVTIIRLAQALNCPPSDFFQREDNK